VFEGCGLDDESVSRRYSAGELASEIRGRREYRRGAIRLLACRGLVAGDGRVAPAMQALADALGVPVMGHLDLGWFSASSRGSFGLARGEEDGWGSRRRIGGWATDSGYRIDGGPAQTFYPSRGGRRSAESR
jgi:hypothetical protein